MWVPDVLMSILFISTLMVMYYQYSLNLSAGNRGVLDRLIFDAEIMGETLVSPGYPPGWDASTVERPGLTDGNQRLNLTKLTYVANLTYYDLKYFFGTTYDYYIVLREPGEDGALLNISEMTARNDSWLSPEGGLGLPGMTLETLALRNTSDHMVRTVRYLITNSTTVKLLIYLWD